MGWTDALEEGNLGALDAGENRKVGSRKDAKSAKRGSNSGDSLPISVLN